MNLKLEEYKMLMSNRQEEILIYFNITESTGLRDEHFLEYFTNFHQDKMSEIELLRCFNDTPEYLKIITDKSKYNGVEIMNNLKNCLIGKNADIISNGPDYMDYNNIDKNKLIVCIKFAVNLIKNPDIIVFNERVYKTNRAGFDYSCINNPFSIFISDFYMDYNYIDHLKSMEHSFGDISQFPFYPNLIFTTKGLCRYSVYTSTSVYDEIRKIEDDYFYDINCSSVPTEINVINILKYMGIKNIDLYGVEIFLKEGLEFFKSNTAITDIKTYKCEEIPNDTCCTVFVSNYCNFNFENVLLHTNKVSNCSYRISRTCPIELTSENHIYVDFLNNYTGRDFEECNFKINEYNNRQFLKFLNHLYIKYNNKIAGKMIDDFLFDYTELPEDFNWKEYIRLYKDLKHLNETNAKIHYLRNGIREGRYYKFEQIKDQIPNDFLWTKYIELNEDLKIFNEIDAMIHYIKIGIKEKRNFV